MKPRFSANLLSILAISFSVTPAFAEMTADQHYEKGKQENTDGKFLESVADFDAAIKIQPDYWKAYANRASAEYNLKRYQAAQNDINTAMAHLPPLKGLTDLKATIDRALQPAVSSADMQRRMIALQALQRLSAIQSGVAYPGQFGGPAYGISQLSNTLISHGYKIPNNLVHPNTVSLIHPNGQPGATTPQPVQGEASENNAKLASMIGATGAMPQPAGQEATSSKESTSKVSASKNSTSKVFSPKDSTSKVSATKAATTKILTSNVATAGNAPSQAPASEAEAKLAMLAGSGSPPAQSSAPEDSKPAPNYLEQGTEKTRAGDWAGAIADFDQYINQDPNNFVGYADRGAAKLQTGDTQGAIADLDKAVQLMPDTPETKDFRDKLKAAIEQAKQIMNAGH